MYKQDSTGPSATDEFPEAESFTDEKSD